MRPACSAAVLIAAAALPCAASAREQLQAELGFGRPRCFRAWLALLTRCSICRHAAEVEMEPSGSSARMLGTSVVLSDEAREEDFAPADVEVRLGPLDSGTGAHS